MVELASRTERRVLDAYRDYDAGGLTRRELEAAVATIVTTANRRGAGIGDVALANILTRRRREAVEPLGIDRDEDRDQRRLQGSVATILAYEVEQHRTRLARMADAEPKDAVQAAFGQAMQRRGASGWRRDPEPDACDFCMKLYAGGATYPADAVMYRHPGCVCTQQPIFDD